MLKKITCYSAILALILSCKGADEMPSVEKRLQEDVPVINPTKSSDAAEHSENPDNLGDIEVQVNEGTIDGTKSDPNVPPPKPFKLNCKGIASRETPEMGIKIGCRILNEAGQRVGAESLKIDPVNYKYETKLLPPGLMTAIEPLTNDPNYDVAYDFSGIDPKLLFRAAYAASYVYSRINEAGKLEKLTSTVTSENIGLSLVDMCTGTRIDGVCYFETEVSCAEECGSRAGIADSRYTNRVTSEAFCRDVYSKLLNRSYVPFGLTEQSSGFGCLNMLAGGNRYFFSGNGKVDPNFTPVSNGENQSKVLCACAARTTP